MIRVLHLQAMYERNYPLFNEYVNALPDDKFSSIVCYLSGGPDGKNGVEAIASEVIYLGFSKKSLKVFNVKAIRALIRIMREHRIDIVHCHRHKVTVFGTIAAFFAGVPNVISHVHGLSRTRTLARHITNCIVLRSVKRIIAVSEAVNRDIIKNNWFLDVSKVVTVRNGIDLKDIDAVVTDNRSAKAKMGISEKDIVFGTVGRLVPTKGQTYLIDAFADVVRKVPHVKLVVIGEGSLDGELKRKARDMNLASHILFLGYRDDVLELIRGFDVFVLPSVAEGLSIALLEAMASGIPVIASDIGGIPEVFASGDCGILIPAKDPSALSEAMHKTVVADYEGRAMMGSFARKRVEDAFAIGIMHEGMRHVYESILSS